MMKSKRPTLSGSSSTKPRCCEQNTNQESQFFSGPEKRPEPTIEQIVVKSMDSQQIIKEKIYMMIPKEVQTRSEKLLTNNNSPEKKMPDRMMRIAGSRQDEDGTRMIHE